MKTEEEYLKDIGLETHADFHLSGKTIPELMKGYAKYYHQQKLAEDNTRDLLHDIISWEKDLSEYKSLEGILRKRYIIIKR